MAPTPAAPDDTWEPALGENVTCLWTGNTGTIIARTESIHADVEYLVEYVNRNDELVRSLVFIDAIDPVNRTRH